MTENKKIHTCWELFGVECGSGWSWIVVGLLQAALDKGAYIIQVKEKYGGLRFYYTGGDDQLSELVEFAEGLSYKTCELCGAPGEHQYDGWWELTRCPEHSEGLSTTAPEI